MIKYILVLLFNLIAFIGICQDLTYVCPPCNRKCDNLEFDRPGVCTDCNMTLVKSTEIVKPSDRDFTIAFYLQPGVEVLDFAGPMEVFSYAGFKVFTVSKTKEPIVSQGILTIIPDYDLSDCPTPDIVAFFGGNGRSFLGNEAVKNWILGFENLEYYFSVCTGAYALAEAGLLDGKKATTFHGSLDDFENKYDSIEVLRDVRYVDNGKIITTAGVSAGIDGALHLVAKIKGLEMAENVVEYMEYDKWIPDQGIVVKNEE